MEKPDDQIFAGCILAASATTNYDNHDQAMNDLRAQNMYLIISGQKVKLTLS